MSVVPIDGARLHDALDRAGQRVASLLRSAPDGGAKVSGLDWTVAELGAHLVNEAERFDRFGRGVTQSLADVATVNAQEIATVEERDPARLAERFASSHEAFLAIARRHGSDDAYTWFETPMTWAEAGGIYLGELSIHSVDLARTLGRKVRIERDDALLVAYGLLRLLPMFVDPVQAKGFTATYKLKLRGGAPLLLSFVDGELTITRARREADASDCTISADPEAFLLVGYGRTSQWGPILRGKILASGRRPWLGLRFNSLLVNP